LGLSPEIVDQAKKLLSEEALQAERYLEQLRHQLQSLGERQATLDRRIRQAREREEQLELEFGRKERKLRQTTEKKIEQLAADFGRETQRFVKSIKDRFEASRVRKEAKRKEALLKEAFRRKMSSERQTEGQSATRIGAGSEIVQGAWVYHSFFQKSGQVMGVEGKEIIVEIEGKRISAHSQQLQPVGEERISSKPLRNVVLNVVQEKRKELNLVGLRVEEALARTDKFLDRALLSDLNEVRIIHGLGKGRLSSALSDFLNQHPHVQEHRLEGPVTMVALRE